MDSWFPRSQKQDPWHPSLVQEQAVENLAKGSALEIPLDEYQACSGSAAEGRMGKVL